MTIAFTEQIAITSDNGEQHVDRSEGQNGQSKTSTPEDNYDDDSILDIYSEEKDGQKDINDNNVIRKETAEISERLEINEADEDEDSTSSDGESEDTHRNVP